ncbi:uncharacterized protein LOC134187880 isoform X2 [Corticium candelabrum]|nr:uncharacterized protein LOC134187880 isoform X2 [Corticium candelabrum]
MMAAAVGNPFLSIIVEPSQSCKWLAFCILIGDERTRKGNKEIRLEKSANVLAPSATLQQLRQEPHKPSNTMMTDDHTGVQSQIQSVTAISGSPNFEKSDLRPRKKTPKYIDFDAEDNEIALTMQGTSSMAEFEKDLNNDNGLETLTSQTVDESPKREKRKRVKFSNATGAKKEELSQKL